MSDYQPRKRTNANQAKPSNQTERPERSTGASSRQRTARTSSRPQTARSSAAAYTPHRRQVVSSPSAKKNRLVAYAAVLAVVVVALVLGIGTLTSGGPGPQGEGGSEADPPLQEGVNYPDPATLEWRDQDFAVNPGYADWNYERPEEKVIYLTFDDGPSKNTQAILDILDQYDAKATFFVIGHDTEYFPMIAEAYRRGHTIGMHSMTHAYDQVYPSTDAYFEDLDAIGEVVKEQIGYVPCFIRFPGGSSNTVSRKYSEGIMTTLTQMVQERGYQYYDWNLDSGDGANASVETMIEQASIDPESKGPYVVLFHDSATKGNTVEALPTIIENFQELGYAFAAIDRTSWVDHHSVNN